MDNPAQVINVLTNYMSYNGKYHDHKETMTWSATAFYLTAMVALSGFVLTHKILSDQEILGFQIHLSCLVKFFLFALVLIASILVYNFVGHQLKAKLIAAKRVQSCAKNIFALTKSKILPSIREETDQNEYNPLSIFIEDELISLSKEVNFLTISRTTENTMKILLVFASFFVLLCVLFGWGIFTGI